MHKRLLILSDINSAHTQKWCIDLAKTGFSVGIFTLSFPVSTWYESFKNISVFCPIHFEEDTFRLSAISKLKYLKAVTPLRKVIRDFTPDIVHAHYASSYGLIGALTGFRPYLISAWGSDLMDFPDKSFLKARLLKYIFKKADRIFATSKTLATHAEKFSSKKIDIIPFGVDSEKFKPVKVESIFNTDSTVIGTVKSMEQIYGIDVLIKSFAKLNLKNPHLNLRLLLVGSGSKEAEYMHLVEDLNICDQTLFAGRIGHSELVKYYNMIDIFVNVSRNESFGVSVLEASACGLPVVVSRVGGLTEVVEENKTGFYVEPDNINELTLILEKMITDHTLRIQLGNAGREFVKSNYEWKDSLAAMENVYLTL
jgi:glycosyltransferase involved in cell wall biosynthesis